MILRKKYYSFIKSHNLVNRIFDMLDYFNFFHNEKNIKKSKLLIKRKLQNIYYVETIAKYFEEKKEKHFKNVELACNLRDLITDLDYLKQYLVK